MNTMLLLAGAVMGAWLYRRHVLAVMRAYRAGKAVRGGQAAPQFVQAHSALLLEDVRRTPRAGP